MNKEINGKDLSKMSLEELELLYKNMEHPNAKQKETALKKMDTGIYNEKGILIGDKCEEDDAYEE